jgi:hypothetical protein
MSVTFDGPNRLITISSGQVSLDVKDDIYTAWKEWVVQSDNIKYPAAFRVVGGDPLGGGVNAGSYFFLQNQNGWRIKPPEEDIIITITGNLYAEEVSESLFNTADGNFNTSIRLSTSSLTQEKVVVSGSGVTEQDKADIASAVWDENLSSA